MIYLIKNTLKFVVNYKGMQKKSFTVHLNTLLVFDCIRNQVNQIFVSDLVVSCM